MKITRSYKHLTLHDDDGNEYSVATLLAKLIDYPKITLKININGVPVDMEADDAQAS